MSTRQSRDPKRKGDAPEGRDLPLDSAEARTADPQGEGAAAQPRGAPDEKGMARRRFLQASGAFLVGAGLASCEPGTEPPLGTPAALPQVPQPAPRFVPRNAGLVRGQYPAVPDTPTERPPEGLLNFFSLHEAQTVEAITARLLPGTPDDPGAREAGVVYYIDTLLSYTSGFGEATYRMPPFAETYTGDAPPTTDTNGFDVVWVAEDEAERYGYQSILTPRETYRAGLASLDRYANERFQADFVALSEAQQDAIVQAMLDGDATTFENPTGEAFFHVLRRHTCEGMFSDPVYGGNRDMVGWSLIGYPGAQRAYTEDEIRATDFARAPQSILDMHEFHAGHDANEHVVLPVTGSRVKDGEAQE